MEVIRQFNASGKSVSVKIYGTTERPLFNAADVASALGVSDYRHTLLKLDEDDVDTIIADTAGGEQTIKVLTDGGVIHWAFICRTKTGALVRKWVKTIVKEITQKGSVTLHESFDKTKNALLSTVIHNSETLIKSFEGKSCFYLMKVADLKDGSKIVKLGESNVSINQRYGDHCREYAHLKTVEGKVTCLFAIECRNPVKVEKGMMEMLFPEHKYTLKDQRRDELVHVDSDKLSLSKLIQMSRDYVAKHDSFDFDYNYWKGKYEAIVEQNTLLLNKMMSSTQAITEMVSVGIQTDFDFKNKSEVSTVVHISEQPAPRYNEPRLRIQQLRKKPDGSFEQVKLFDGVNDILSEIEGLTRSVVNNAISKRRNCYGFYYREIPNNVCPTTMQPFVEGKETTKAPIQAIAKLSSDKTEVLKVFENQTKVATELGFNKCTIGQHVNNKTIFKKFYWYKWSELSDELQQRYLTKNDGILYHTLKPVTIRTNVKTGEVVEHKGHFRDVARRLKHSDDHVKKVLNTDKPHLGYLYKMEMRLLPVYP